MATLTTYLLVSGVENLESVRSHDVFEQYAFDEQDARNPGDGQPAALRFALEQPLEESTELEEALRQLSADLPDASVVVCEVEERFDQIERVQVAVYQDGNRGGALEHGYVFNVGAG
jgi:hypothetical protein